MAYRRRFRVVVAVTVMWSLLVFPGAGWAQGGVAPLTLGSAVDAGAEYVLGIAATDQEAYYVLDLEDVPTANIFGRFLIEIGSVSFNPATGEFDGDTRWQRTFDTESQHDTDVLHGEATRISYVEASVDGAYVYFVMHGFDTAPPRLIRVDTETKAMAVLPLNLHGNNQLVEAFAVAPNGEEAFVLSRNGRLVRVQLAGQTCDTNVVCGGMGEDVVFATNLHDTSRPGLLSALWRFTDDASYVYIYGGNTGMRVVEVDLVQMVRTGRELNLTHPDYEEDDSFIGQTFTAGSYLYAAVSDYDDVGDFRDRLVKIDPVTFTVVDELLFTGIDVTGSEMAVTDSTGTWAYLVDDDFESLVRVNLHSFTVVDVFTPELQDDRAIYALAAYGRYVLLGTTKETLDSRLVVVEGARVQTAPVQTPTGGGGAVAPVAANFSGMVACEATRLARFVDVPVTSTHASAIGCLFAGEIVTEFGEDTFRPHAAMTRGQVASMLFRVLVNAGWEPVAGDASFVDVAGVHQDAIVGLANAGIVSGFADGRFAPDVPVTRGQFASMLVRASEVAGRPLATATLSFHDVPLGSLHASAVGALEEAGMVAGFADGTFRPESRVTRGQVASLLVRWLDPSGTAVAGSVR